jgi:uncharacterized protein YrrD
MYILSKSLIELPILSLQTGQPIAHTNSSIIDPSVLCLMALGCEKVEGIARPIILIRDIREFAVDCILVNSEAAMSEAEDIVRLKALLDEPFILINIRVVTEGGRSLGRVEDYTVNTETFQIQKLYIHPTLLKSIFGSSLIIDRSQIIDITPHLITVKETTTAIPVSSEVAPTLRP